MKPSALALTVLLTTGIWAAAAAQDATTPGLREQAFKVGGRVSLDLSAGGYTVKGSNDDMIRVRWRTGDPNEMSRASADIAVQGTSATIRTRGPQNRFKVEIELPRRTDVQLSLSAGDLDMIGLEGNKDVSMWAGDLTIEVGEGTQYRQVDASVRFGEISPVPFGRSKGGIFRSFHWTGSGQYTINARLFAGDLKLVR